MIVSRRPLRLAALTMTVLLASLPALAQTAAPTAAPGATPTAAPPSLPFTGDDIEAAAFAGGDLPPGRSALTAKVQILLDRSGISPGVVDGFKGGMSETAIRAFERKTGLPVDGMMDPAVWAELQAFAGGPVTQQYTITEADAEGLVEAIPADYAEKAKMESLGYTSVAEKLAERFHMDERFIAFLNPGRQMVPGETITVMAPAKPLKGEVARIIVDKEAHRVAAYAADGTLVVDYPATIGSSDNPSPSGDHLVLGVAINPDYTYNPNINFKQGDNDKVLRIPPGPNGPVGSVWIDLDKPTYGIHGTPTPSQLFVNQSHGCVRLTNWDAEELAKMVKPNLTRVEFLAPGVHIADVTPPVPPRAPIAGPTGTVAPPPAVVSAAPRARPGTIVTIAGTAASDAAAAVATEAGTAVAEPATADAAPAGTIVSVSPARRPTNGTAATPAIAADPLASALDTATGGEAGVQAITPEPGGYQLPLPGAPAPDAAAGN